MKKNKLIIVFTAFVFVVSLAGCGMFMPAAVPVVETEAVLTELADLTPDLTVDQVNQIKDEESIVIIDVREEYEYQEGHIPGAILIPLAEIPDRINEIPADGSVVLVCRSGNRSGQAYGYLNKQGFDNIHNMLGGMLEWTASGYEVEY